MGDLNDDIRTLIRDLSRALAAATTSDNAKEHFTLVARAEAMDRRLQDE